MFFKNKNTLLLSLAMIFFLAGCTVKKEPEKKEIIVKKKKEYKREKISVGLINSIIEIKLLLSQQNIIKLNDKFIHKKYGFYDKYRFQNNIIFKHKSFLNIIKNNDDYFSIENSIKRVKKDLLKLKLYDYNPIFNCSPHNDKFYGWDKQGLFLSDDIDKPLLSKSNLSRNKDSKEEYEHALLIDKTSYKLVFSEDEIIMYLTKIDRNWYITLFDRVQTDCSTYKEKRKKRVRKKK